MTTAAGSALTPAPPAPPAARAVFGDVLPVIERYASLLAGAGVERGLIGPRETPRLWERHLLNSVGPAELLDPDCTVVDLGSGAGLPGLVLAALRPDTTMVLVEPLLRRATFLTEAVEALGLDNVRVHRARAEDLAGSGLTAAGVPVPGLVDVVVARAVAPLDRLAGWALPLLRPGGRLLAVKGESADDELARCRPALRRAGAAEEHVADVGDPALHTAARVVVAVAGERLRPRPVPRRRSR